MITDTTQPQGKGICTIEHHGMFSTKTASITKDKIHYDGGEYDIKKITHIRYALTDKYINGAYNKTETMVAFGDTESEQIINWLDIDEFKTFTTALWHAVGHNLILAMVAQLAQGRDVCGVIFDDRVLLRKEHLISNERKYFKWDEVYWYVAQGALIIESKKDKRFREGFYFHYINNAHVIDGMLELFSKNHASTISESFGLNSESAKQMRQICFSDKPCDDEHIERPSSTRTLSTAKTEDSIIIWVGLVFFVFLAVMALFFGD